MKMRIGIYTNQYPGISGCGGIGTYTHSLATGLAALGQDVHVLTNAPAYAPPKEINGVQVHCLHPGYLPVAERWLPGLRAAWQISHHAMQLVKSFALDVFEFPNWEGGGCFFKSPKTPKVVRLH